MRHLPLASLVLLGIAAGAFAQATKAALEFPPGVFTDGGQYQISDFRGKLLVIFLFDDIGGALRERTRSQGLVEQFRGQPVKFLAVAPNLLSGAAANAAKTAQLPMPLFIDPLAIMGARCGFRSSPALRNPELVFIPSVAYVIVGPEGTIVARTATLESINAALASIKWKYKDGGYDKRLDPAIELFEWNQFEAGMRLLRPMLRSTNKPLADSAAKLYAAIKAEAEQWKADADARLQDNPVEAYDQYGRIAAVFAGDELGKAVQEPLGKLKSSKNVQQELAARREWQTVSRAMIAAQQTPAARKEIADYCRSLAARYPDTPTGSKAAAFSAEILFSDGAN